MTTASEASTIDQFDCDDSAASVNRFWNEAILNLFVGSDMSYELFEASFHNILRELVDQNSSMYLYLSHKERMAAAASLILVQELLVHKAISLGFVAFVMYDDTEQLPEPTPKDGKVADLREFYTSSNGHAYILGQVPKEVYRMTLKAHLMKSKYPEMTHEWATLRLLVLMYTRMRLMERDDLLAFEPTGTAFISVAGTLGMFCFSRGVLQVTLSLHELRKFLDSMSA